VRKGGGTGTTDGVSAPNEALRKGHLVLNHHGHHLKLCSLCDLLPSAILGFWNRQALRFPYANGLLALFLFKAQKLFKKKKREKERKEIQSTSANVSYFLLSLTPSSVTWPDPAAGLKEAEDLPVKGPSGL
jgi:hypothetical protein